MRLKTIPSRLTVAHLQRLLDDGGRPSSSPPISAGTAQPRALTTSDTGSVHGGPRPPPGGRTIQSDKPEGTPPMTWVEKCGDMILGEAVQERRIPTNLCRSGAGHRLVHETTSGAKPPSV
jgi:hypothetical protein